MNTLDYDFDIWYNSYDPNFIDICARSKVPEKWVSYDRVINGKYANSLIKPINSYAENLYPSPTLVSINNKTITLRQHTHAEILLLQTEDKLKALDRPWIRQFYQSSKSYEDATESFEDSFVAYAPWFIDENVQATITQVDGSPFLIKNVEHRYRQCSANEKYIYPLMVPFRFRDTGPHMQTKYFGKVKRNTPIFDITFDANDIIIERVRDFYEKRN